jgi:UPF0716 protein FxsA
MPLLVLLFIVVPIAELYVIIKIGAVIGLWPTLAILVGDAILGSLLLRQQGREAWQRFNAAIAEGRFPGREAADGVMVAAGGTLLLTPGFITDVVGLLLLLPPTRAGIRRGLFGFLRRRFALVGGAVGGYRRVRDHRRGGDRATADRTAAEGRYDVEGSAEEVSGDQPQGGERGDRERPPLPP